MGQYYRPVSLDKKEYIKSWDYDNGAKLMEHSYIGNTFVSTVEKLLSPGNSWYKTRLIWMGDYSNYDDLNEDRFFKIRENYFQSMGNANDETKESLWNIFELDEYKDLGKELSNEHFRYIINHSTKEYIDTRRTETKDGWDIHPLSLLTCIGNGRGGGDYRGFNEDELGLWAGDIISCENEISNYSDYTEFNTEFEEN